MSDEICASCHFYEPDDEDTDFGACRRYPRVYHPQGGWVVTVQREDDWCGEFKPHRLELN